MWNSVKKHPIWSAVPGPALAWVNSILGIFTNTALYPHDHSGYPDQTAAALATVAVLGGYYGFSRAPIKTQLYSGILCGGVAGLFVVAIFIVRNSLKYEIPKNPELLLQSLWYYLYLGMIVLICMTLMLLIKYAAIRSR
jgi:uncharacterized membrane protein